MSRLSVLLVQARDRGDAMAAHERACIERRVGLGVTLTTRNALAEEPRPDWVAGHDALIIGGSGAHSVHDPRSRPWVSALRRVLDEALRRALPGFGLCFGHQLLGHHFGAAVRTDERQAEVGTVEVELTPAGKSDPLFGTLDAYFPAHTGHSDSVDRVPEGLELLASNTTLRTQAFKVRDVRFYSTQFHPDLTGAEAVVRYCANKNIPPEAGLALFRPGADAAVTLLRSFVDDLVDALDATPANDASKHSRDNLLRLV
jgi:GMP synthase (glutamine-hydrolysing)